MSTARVVVLGGSAVATPELVAAIVNMPNRTVSIDLVLVGRSPEKLELVARVAQLHADQDPLVHISHTTRVEEALTGADYVINQIRVGGLESRAFDESFPHDLGLPGEETVGPGGFANASRTIPVVLDYVRLIERYCPNATILTFTNPSSMVQYAIQRYSSVSTIGLCDGPVHLAETMARTLGAPLDQLVVDYVGMHHFGWVTRVWWRGRDVLPALLERVTEVAGDVDPALVQAIGAIPGPYLNYVFHPDRVLAQKAGRRTRAEELLDLQGEILADFQRAIANRQKSTALARRKARWYQAIVAPVLIALLEGRNGLNISARFVLNVTNGHAMPWLPPEAVVEIPVLLDAGRICPLLTGPVPRDVMALLQLNCTYEMLAVEAIIERNRSKAVRALLVNPLIRTYDQAVAVVDRAWGPGVRGAHSGA